MDTIQTSVGSEGAKASAPATKITNGSGATQSVKAAGIEADFDSFDDLGENEEYTAASSDSGKGDSSDGQESEETSEAQNQEEKEVSEAATDLDLSETEGEAQVEEPEATEEKAETAEGTAPEAIKFKSGDKEIELTPDSTVQVKVGGQTETVSVKDLMADYAGKTDWTRKYSALDVERKDFNNQVQDLDGKVNKLYDLAVTQKKPREAIAFLAEAMGGDPREVWQSLKSQIKDAESKLEGMSEEEIAAQDAREEADYYRNKIEQQKEAEKLEAATATLRSEVESVMKQHSLSKEQFKSLYDELAAHAKDANIDIDTLTPELVGQWHETKARQSSLRDMVGKSFADAPNKVDLLTQLSEVWNQNPTFSLQDIEDIATQVFATPKKEQPKSSLVKKVQKAKKAETQRNEMVSPESFDDL